MAQEVFPEYQVILVPGLHDSGPDHWQTRWQRAHPEFWRVRQADWSDPDLPAWAAQVDQLRGLDPRPALLVAHSFGCLAAMASMAAFPRGVAGALLVAPADPDKFGVAGLLPWRPVDCPSLLIKSLDDPWMRPDQADLWAGRWGCEVHSAGACGHINAESGLGDWEFGRQRLQLLYDRAHNHHPAMPAMAAMSA
jgi:predicted alpha/beta hydrolase family esterase